MGKILDGLKQLSKQLGQSMELDKRAVENLRANNEAARKQGESLRVEREKPNRQR